MLVEVLGFIYFPSEQLKHESLLPLRHKPQELEQVEHKESIDFIQMTHVEGSDGLQVKQFLSQSTR